MDGLKYFINGVCDLVSLNIRGSFECREEIFVPLMERMTNLTELSNTLSFHFTNTKISEAVRILKILEWKQLLKIVPT